MKTEYIEQNTSELAEIRGKIEAIESGYSEYLNTPGKKGDGAQDHSVLIGKLKNQYNIMLRTIIVNAFKSGNKKIIVSLLEIKDSELYIQSDFPEDCPWHSLRSTNITEVINNIYSPIMEYMPLTYKLLSNFCIGIASIKYQKTGWHLLYFIHYKVTGQTRPLFPL